jgi:acyl-CoA thioester hydrolase
VTSRPASPSSNTASFEQTIRVEQSDLDDQEHVNNLVYVRWVLDVATAHWASLTTPEIRAEVGWVLLRHEIDYHSPALLGDIVVVRTEVGHLKGLTFERNTTVRSAETSRTLAASRTLWCPVDPRTGRPRRVSAELRALFSVGERDREAR